MTLRSKLAAAAILASFFWVTNFIVQEGARRTQEQLKVLSGDIKFLHSDVGKKIEMSQHETKLLVAAAVHTATGVTAGTAAVEPTAPTNTRPVLSLIGDAVGIPPATKSKVEAWMNTDHEVKVEDTVIPNALVYNWHDSSGIVSNMIPDYATGGVMVKSTVTKPPFFMAMPGYHTDYIANFIMQRGTWEPTITNFFQYILGAGATCSPDKTVVDIGANIGYFSGYLVACGCKVISVELQARMANWDVATMMLNQKLDGQFKHYSMGLSNTKADVEVHSATGAGSWFVAEIASADTGSYYEELKDGRYVVEKARLRKWDDLFADVDSIYFMKMDIDGHEAKAIDGMRGTIKARKIKHMQLELDPFLWKESASHDTGFGIQATNLLIDAGYHAYIAADPRFNDHDEYGVIDCSLPEIGGVQHTLQAIPDENMKRWVAALPGRYPGYKNANLHFTSEDLGCWG
jgi:FkbM family methyltransferase